MPFRKLTPEEKVEHAVRMSWAVTRICIDSILNRNPKATEREIIEEIRRRIRYGRTKHLEV